MQPLYHLAVLIQQLGPHHVPLNFSGEHGASAAQLFNLIRRSKRLPSIEQAALVLSRTDQPDYVQSVIEELQLILLNGLAAISNRDVGNSVAAQASRYVWKLIAVAKRQSLVADSVLVIPYLKEAFRLAEHHAFTDAARVAIELLALLRANRYYDKRDYAESRAKAAYYRELSRRLRQLKSGMNHLDLLERDHPPLRTRRAAVLALSSEMAPLRAATDNLRFNLSYFAFEIKCYFLEEDYPGVIAKAHEALAYCQEQPSRFQEATAPFIASLSIGLLQTDQPEKAIGYAKQLLRVQAKDSLQYSKTIELIILLSFRSGAWQQAADYFTVFQKDLRTERWPTYPIFASYLMLLEKTAKIELTRSLSYGSRRKITTYLHRAKTDNAPADQEMHLLIVAFSVDLLAGKYADCRAWLVQIAKLSPELKEPRMKYFLAMLKIIPEQAFHRVAVERHAAKYLKKLTKTPTTSRPLAEVIPFPEGWSLIVKQLGTRRISTRASRKKTSV